VYASESSATPLWAEFHDDVEVDDGAFAILLGENTLLPDDLFDDPERWMEIQVDGTTLSPRQRFTSVPYALNADKLDGHDAADFSTSELPSGAIVWFREGTNPSGFTLVTSTLGVDVGSWEPLPDMPAGVSGVRCDVWTGSEVLCWNDDYDTTPTGARYDVSGESWTVITSTNGPAAREGRSAVWTGQEMIVWGGETSINVYTNTGKGYNLTSDSWAPISTAGAPTPRGPHGAVWAGDKMMIWGGQTAALGVLTNTGALYDPAMDSWTPITTTGAPGAMRTPHLLWTGSKVIVWGESSSLSTGALYDPTTDTWTPMSSAPESLAYVGPAVWTGSEMATLEHSYDGFIYFYNPDSDTWRKKHLHLIASYSAGRSLVAAGDLLLLSDGVYDLSQDRQIALANEAQCIDDPYFYDYDVFWTGNSVLFPNRGLSHVIDIIYPYEKE
jgi:hypothetical protein